MLGHLFQVVIRAEVGVHESLGGTPDQEAEGFSQILGGQVWQDGTTELLQNQQEKKIAQYATLGYHIGKVTIYGSYSTHYKAAVGIGFNW